MNALTPLEAPINAEILIEEARKAREQQAADQVAAHVRAVLSRLKCRIQKPLGGAA